MKVAQYMYDPRDNHNKNKKLINYFFTELAKSDLDNHKRLYSIVNL